MAGIKIKTRRGVRLFVSSLGRHKLRCERRCAIVMEVSLEDSLLQGKCKWIICCSGVVVRQSSVRNRHVVGKLPVYTSASCCAAQAGDEGE